MDIATYIGRLSDRLTEHMLFQYGAEGAVDLVKDRQGVMRKSQIAAIMATSIPMMTANILNVLALVALEFHVGSLVAGTLVWAALVMLFASYGLFSAFKFHRATPRETASQRAPGKIAISSVLLALIWCYPLFAILPDGELMEVAFMSALIAGMIAGGALALYPVPLAVFLYTTILSTAAERPL